MLYFNVLTQQIQEPITESAQDSNKLNVQKYACHNQLLTK
jgi:hypothetical protein